jgi:UDP-N-acetylmuramate--alanine ligase
MLEAGLDPTAVVGAFLPALGNANARLGAGDWFIAESDESDGSFLQSTPIIAVLTNIDREHLDHYGSFDNDPLRLRSLHQPDRPSRRGRRLPR